MKQTHEPSEWYAGIIARVRTETETLLDDYSAVPSPKTPAEVERAAKALLAIARLAAFADRLSVKPTDEGAAEAPPPLNRHERRRLEALGKARPPATLPAP